MRGWEFISTASYNFHGAVTLTYYREGAMDEGDRDHEIAQDAESLIGHIESELQYDEEGRSYLTRSAVIALVFKITEFLRHLSRRI